MGVVYCLCAVPNSVLSLCCDNSVLRRKPGPACEGRNFTLSCRPVLTMKQQHESEAIDCGVYRENARSPRRSIPVRRAEQRENPPWSHQESKQLEAIASRMLPPRRRHRPQPRGARFPSPASALRGPAQPKITMALSLPLPVRYRRQSPTKPKQHKRQYLVGLAVHSAGTIGKEGVPVCRTCLSRERLLLARMDATPTDAHVDTAVSTTQEEAVQTSPYDLHLGSVYHSTRVCNTVKTSLHHE